MINKVVFIINSIQSQRCIKRVQEFIDCKYEVEVYGFGRPFEIKELSFPFDITILDVFPTGNYYSRLKKLCNNLSRLFHKYKGERVLYYYFGLDIALVSYYLNRSESYVFEESDMSHAYVSNPIIRKTLELQCRKIIRNSFETVFTSEGFSLYHFSNMPPDNISIITNRINKNILEYDILPKKKLSLQNMKIGFVGGARYKSVINFVHVLANNFPNIEFHFFGNIVSSHNEFDKLRSYENVFFHGPFSNPSDLPSIYSSIDLVLSTYDYESLNVRYAEPNKLYEAIFFQTPIIVTKGTFLANKVQEMNVGYEIDPLNDAEIIQFLKSLSVSDILVKMEACDSIPKQQCVNDNVVFFKKIAHKLSSIK